MRTLHLIASLLILSSGPIHSQTASSPSPFRLRVTGVDGTALSLVVADVLGRDIAVGPFLSRSRFNFDSEYGSYDEFLGDISVRLSARTTQYDGTLILKHPCLGDPSDQLPESALSDKIVLLFEHAVLRDVMDEVGSSYSLRFNADQSSEMFFAQDISMRIREKSIRSAFHALAFASGLQLSEERNRFIRVQRVTSTRGCKLPFAVVEPRSRVNAKTGKASAQCPEGADGKPMPRCGPLERFESRCLVARGFAAYQGQRIAVVEAPDSHLWAVKVGEYVGRDFGKVVDIGDDEVLLLEIVLNEDGDAYVERERLLPYPRP